MDAGHKRIEKRNRPPLSCEPCRARKSKCNRASPCDSCIKRNQPSSCQYALNVRRSETGVPKKSNLTDRLKNLEALVSSFAAQDLVVQQRKRTNGDSAITDHQDAHALNAMSSEEPEQPSLTPKPGPNASNQSKSQKGLNPETPRIRQTPNGHVNYVDSSHWLSVLEDIREVREHLSVPGGFLPQDMPSSSSASWEPELPEVSSVLGLDTSISLDEILTSLPPRPMCDRLLSHYFNSRFQVLGIIHPFAFQKEYESFWEAPSKAPALWIALLFSVLSLSTILLWLPRAHEPDNESLPRAKILQQRTAECLILGRFATANAYALEAFILHLQSRFLSERNSNAHVHIWFEMGTIIRLAFRMGYHRDPSTMPGTSPFDAEMRRRVWVNIFQVDALMSFQMGFPSMIPTEYCDAQPPRNLEYSDLRLEMETLPPSRPVSDDTPILYIIAKSSVMGTFKKIVVHAQSLASPTYDKTIALDLEARDVYNRVPETLQRRDVSCCFLDTSTRILERCNIELLYLKSIIILHRRFVSYEPATTSSFETSRRACAEAALGILARQADLHQASKPGGRLYEDRWMLGSLMVHDFLLAAMVLCLDLSVRLRFDKTAADDDVAARAYLALHTSRQVWAATSSLSPEAGTAAFALDLMLRKAGEKNAVFLMTQQGDTFPSTIDMAPSLVYSESGLPYADLMSDVIDGSKTPDWNLLDQYFQNPTMETPGADAATWSGEPLQVFPHISWAWNEAR